MVKAEVFLEDYKIITPENLIQNPIISVVMPTYCRGDNGLLERSIRSVLNQTFKELELIVVDDGSIDSTQSVVKKIIKEDNRLVYIRNNINSGLPGLKVNQGIMNARGKYIAYQFDDDQWYEDAMENLYNEIIKYDELTLIYGKCDYIDVVTGLKGELGTYDFDYKDIVHTNLIANNSVLHHKEITYVHGGYDPHITMRRLCDWDIWQRWFKSGVRFKRIPDAVSIVECNQPQSMFRIALHDMGLHRLMESRNRNEQLNLDHISQYKVDDLSFVSDKYLKNKIYQEQILPWMIQKEEIINKKIQLEIEPKKNILVVKRQYDASVDICLKNYSKALDDKYNIIFCPIFQLTPDVIEYADIVVMLRVFETIDKKTQMKLKTKPVIYMLDDDLLNLHTYDPVKFAELLPTSKNYKNLIQYIEGANLCVVFSKPLEEEVKKLNFKIHMLSTNILEKYLNTPQNNKNESIEVIYCGGDSRKEELDFFKDDLLNIAQKYKDKIKFNFWGYLPDWIKSDTNINYEHEDFDMNYYNYMDKLSKRKFDIFLAPLFEDKIKKSKSPIKYLESSVCSSIGIYSDIEVYEKIKHKETGIKIKNQKGELEKAIQDLILMDDADKEDIIAKAKKDITNRYSTQNQIDSFETMIERASLIHQMKDQPLTIIHDSHSELDIDWIEALSETMKRLSIQMQILTIDQNISLNLENLAKKLDIKLNHHPLNIFDFDKDEEEFKERFKKIIKETNAGLCIIQNYGYIIVKTMQDNLTPYIRQDSIMKYIERQDRKDHEIYALLYSYITGSTLKQSNNSDILMSEYLKIKVPLKQIGFKNYFIPSFDELYAVEIQSKDITINEVDIKIYSKNKINLALRELNAKLQDRTSRCVLEKSLKNISGKELFLTASSNEVELQSTSVEINLIYKLELDI